MKVSPLFYFLLAAIIGCAVGAYVEDHDSGYRAGAIAFSIVFVLAAGYNKWRNGKFFADFDGKH